MSGLLHSIRKALASASAVALPHENPAPVQETSIALVQPAHPSDESSDAEFREAAGRVISQLQRRQTEAKYDLDAQTRAEMIQRILGGGPPRDAMGFDARGCPRNLDGTFYTPPTVAIVERAAFDLTRGSMEKSPAHVCGLILPEHPPSIPPTHAERRRRREAYAQYKASRLPD